MVLLGSYIDFKGQILRESFVIHTVTVTVILITTITFKHLCLGL